MKAKLLMTTAALALALGVSGASAQDRTNDTKRERATTQDQRPLAHENERTDNKSKAGQQRAPNAAHNRNTATGGKSASDQTSDQKKNTDSAGQDGTKQPSSAQTTPSNNQPTAAQSKPSTSPAPQNNAATQNKGTSPTAATKDSTAQPSAAQTDPNANKTNQAASPNAAPSTHQQTNNAQAQPAVRVSASLQTEQKTRLTQAVTKLNVKPVTNVNFSVSVGTAVPASISLHPVPTSIVEIVPQYRGYSFFMVRDEVVIVEPRTHKIVDVIERRGSSQARTTTTSERKVNLSQKQREYIRRHSSRRTTTTTTGAAPRTQTVIVGEEVPQTVEIETFPEEVYREVPSVRSYRYIRSGNSVYLVEPGSRRVIEEIE